MKHKIFPLSYLHRNQSKRRLTFFTVQSKTFYITVQRTQNIFVILKVTTTKMKFPSTIDINVYKAYINTAAVRQEHENGINAIDLHWESTESLKDLCIRILAENWHNQPIFSAVDEPEDQRQLLDSLDVSMLKLNDLVAHIQGDDGFWKRCFIARWPNFVLTNIHGKKWIRVR